MDKARLEAMVTMARTLLNTVGSLPAAQQAETLAGALLLMGVGAMGQQAQVTTTTTTAGQVVSDTTVPCQPRVADLTGQGLLWSSAQPKRRLPASMLARWRQTSKQVSPFARLVRTAMMAGIGSDEIADALGVSRNHPAKWARGLCDPRSGRTREYIKTLTRMVREAYAKGNA